MNWLKAIALALLFSPLMIKAQHASRSPDSMAYAYYIKGNDQLINKNFAQALAQAKTGLMFSKGHLWCNFLAGQALVGLKQYNIAAPYLMGVQGRLDDNKDLYKTFIELEYGRDDLEKVRFYAGTALVHFPDDVYFATVKVDVLDKTLKFKESDELMEQLFKKFPNDELLMSTWDNHCLIVSSYYQSKNASGLQQEYAAKVGNYPNGTVKKAAPIVEPQAVAITQPKPEPVRTSENKPTGPAASGTKTKATTTATVPTKTAGTNTATTTTVPVKKTAQPQNTAVQNTNPAYSKASADTINQAKKLRKKGQYADALLMLKAYTTKHPADANALWVYGETELWLGHIDRSLRLYKRAVEADKENDYLLLDYASVLNIAGKVKEYRAVLALLEAKGKKYCSADLINAQRAYWDGDYKQAEKLLNCIWQQEPDNAKALKLLKDIKVAKSGWVKVGIGYAADNQPVKTTIPQISAGVYAGKMFAPQVSAQAFSYNYSKTRSTLYALQVANDATLPKAHLSLTAGAGIFADDKGTQQAVTYKLGVQQQLNHLNWQLLAERKPFVYTPASIDTNVIAQHTMAAVGWERGNSFSGKAVAEAYFFDDQNRLDIVYAWGFLPELRSKNIGIRFGYSYGYTNAKKNNYEASQPLATVLEDPTKPIEGTYNKYFTPSNQKVSSLLVAVSLKAGHADFGISGDYGISAQIDNPYLFVDKDANEQLFINKAYSTEKFQPFGVQVHLDLHLSASAAMSLKYSYKHTWFFDAQTADLGFKFNIVNEKKSRKK